MKANRNGVIQSSILKDRKKELHTVLQAILLFFQPDWNLQKI